jgi:hypothetical protein
LVKHCTCATVTETRAAFLVNSSLARTLFLSAAAIVGGGRNEAADNLNRRSSIMRTTTTPTTPSIFQADDLGKVREIALEEVPGGTFIEIERDSDGRVAYVAHMLNADGTPMTVYVDESFNFVSLD